MKKKVFILLLAFTLLATFVFAGGKKEKTTATTAPEGPQYGGTLTHLNWRIAKQDPGSPNVVDGFWHPTVWLTPVQESPFVGDFEKFGPRGTGEFGYDVLTYIPKEFMKGCLVERWELSPDLSKVVWHVQPGIHWAADNVDWMENREVTAEDVAADLNNYRKGPGGKAFTRYSGDIYATDRYTLVIEFKTYDPYWYYQVGWEDRSGITPPEMEDAGSDQWENQVGTGPFLFKEYVIGSYMAFERNPNWRKTTTIDGVEYKLPFIDKMLWLIIPDVATQVSALRTGKLDYSSWVPNEQWASLEETTPELLSHKTLGGGRGVVLNSANAPLDDVNVRRALMTGTDMLTFQELWGGERLPKHWYPVSYGHTEALYTPLEKLPAESRVLYDYNPELAKKMLADAGYPEGFKFTWVTLSDAYSLDEAALLKDQWSKIGVDVEIDSRDRAAFTKYVYEGLYPHGAQDSLETFAPLNIIAMGETGNWANYSNPHYDELAKKAKAETDLDKFNSMVKEASLLMLNEVARIPLNPYQVAAFWWPWIKNYYGEMYVRDNDYVTALAYAWIDQDLKAKMGY